LCFRIVRPTGAEVIQTVDTIRNYRRWIHVMIIRDENNNYNDELVGVIEFDFPCSLNWVRNNIFANSIWLTLIIV
jgi:hypothetical protein